MRHQKKARFFFTVQPFSFFTGAHVCWTGLAQGSTLDCKNAWPQKKILGHVFFLQQKKMLWLARDFLPLTHVIFFQKLWSRWQWAVVLFSSSSVKKKRMTVRTAGIRPIHCAYSPSAARPWHFEYLLQDMTWHAVRGHWPSNSVTGATRQDIW